MITLTTDTIHDWDEETYDEVMKVAEKLVKEHNYNWDNLVDFEIHISISFPDQRKFEGV